MSLSKNQINILTRIHSQSSRAQPPVKDLVKAFKAGGCNVEINGNSHSFEMGNTRIDHVTFSKEKTPHLRSLDKKFAAIATTILLNEVEDFKPDYTKGRSEPRGFPAPIFR